MRIFLIILIFILSLQAWTKADDISDFEIEGMSIGDSLLDYLSKDEILQSETKYYPGSKKFKQVALYDRIKMETYDVVSVALKDNDKNYIIHEIKGFKRFPNHELCLNNRDEVVKDLKNLFNTNSYKINSYESTTAQDENSVFKSVDFEFSMGLIRLYCINWSKKNKRRQRWFLRR